MTFTYELQDYCPDCAVKIGQLHLGGCDVEPCPVCGGQYFSCGCRTDGFFYPRFVWDGHRPCKVHIDALIRRGLFTRWVDGAGWVKCDAVSPGARPDLNELGRSLTWNPDKRDWVDGVDAQVTVRPQESDGRRIEAVQFRLKHGHGHIIALPGIVIVLRGTMQYGHDAGYSMRMRDRALSTAELWGRWARRHDQKVLAAAIRFAWPAGDQ